MRSLDSPSAVPFASCFRFLLSASRLPAVAARGVGGYASASGSARAIVFWCWRHCEWLSFSFSLAVLCCWISWWIYLLSEKCCCLLYLEVLILGSWKILGFDLGFRAVDKRKRLKENSCFPICCTFICFRVCSVLKQNS